MSSRTLESWRAKMPVALNKGENVCFALVPQFFGRALFCNPKVFNLHFW